MSWLAPTLHTKAEYLLRKLSKKSQNSKVHGPAKTPRSTDLVGFTKSSHKQKEKDGDLLTIIAKLQSSHNLFSLAPPSLGHLLSPGLMGWQGEPEFRVGEGGIMKKASEQTSNSLGGRGKGEVACW